MDIYGVDVAACRGRQQRLLAEMARQNLDLAIVARPEHVQWLAGPRFASTFEPVAALCSDGRLTLVAPVKAPEVAAADEVCTYEAKWRSTMRNDQRAASSAALAKALAGKVSPRRIGVEFSSFPQHLAGVFPGALVDLEPDLYRLRRRKDPDELAKLKMAIAGTEAMYRVAREMIRPGVDELDVFNALQGAAVRVYGEMLTGTGNDYACGVHGGPPRDRQAQAGELYILDLGPAFRGYYSDNARTIAVDGRPSDVQMQAWEHVVGVFKLVQQNVKAGKSAKQFFQEALDHLSQSPVGENHSHLGHGIGLFPHEAPHINPNWDDTFELGDVIAVEPALYREDLRAGIRIENNYVVTASGVELLSDFPLHL